MLDVMLSAQKKNKDKGGIGFENGESYKSLNNRDKGKEKVKDKLKESSKD